MQAPNPATRNSEFEQRSLLMKISFAAALLLRSDYSTCLAPNTYANLTTQIDADMKKHFCEGKGVPVCRPKSLEIGRLCGRAGGQVSRNAGHFGVIRRPIVRRRTSKGVSGEAFSTKANKQ
jgi:hypothetical protein